MRIYCPTRRGAVDNIENDVCMWRAHFTMLIEVVCGPLRVFVCFQSNPNGTLHFSYRMFHLIQYYSHPSAQRNMNTCATVRTRRVLRHLHTIRQRALPGRLEHTLSHTHTRAFRSASSSTSSPKLLHWLSTIAPAVHSTTGRSRESSARQHVSARTPARTHRAHIIIASSVCARQQESADSLHGHVRRIRPHPFRTRAHFAGPAQHGGVAD